MNRHEDGPAVIVEDYCWMLGVIALLWEWSW